MSFSFTLSEDDKYQILNNFPNLDYRPSFGGNVLFLIMFYGTKLQDYAHKVFEAYNHGVDFYYTDNVFTRPLFVEAIRYNMYEFFEFLVFNELIDINYEYFSPTNNKKTNCFPIACASNDIRFIKLLIEHNIIYSRYDIQSIKNQNIRMDICRYIVSLVNSSLNLNNNEDTEEDNIKELVIYDFDNFDIIKKLGNGSFGEVSIAKFKDNNKLCVIKKFGDNDNSSFFNFDTIRDINSLRILQKMGHTCGVYGIIQNGNDRYMVLERMKYTVSDYLFFLDSCIFDTQIYNSYIEDLIKQILECVNENSKCGFIHFDLKGANLMINSKNRVKFIDYGISMYLGIFPYTNNVNKDIYNHTYISHDGSEGKIILKNNKNPNDTIEYDGGNINFQKDIPSIALMLIHHKLPSHEPYFVYNGNIYLFYIPNTDVKDKYQNVNESSIKLLKRIYSTRVIEIMYDMLNIEPKKRLNALQLLHKYFYNRPLILPDLDITEVTVTSENKDIYTNIMKSHSDINKLNYLARGFMYFDDIVSFYSDKMLPAKLHNFSEIQLSNMGKIKDILISRQVNMDVICNFLFYILENESQHEQYLSNEVILGEYIVVTNFYEKFYNETTHSIFSTITQISPNDINDVYQVTKSIAPKFYNDINAYNIRPVYLFIAYIRFILQIVCRDVDLINELTYNTIKRVLDYIYEKHCRNNLEISIFNLVKAAYYKDPKAIDISMEFNREYLNIF